MSTLLNIVSWTAIVTSVLQVLTGSLVCCKYIKKQSTGESSIFPFVSGFAACSLWLLYGILTQVQTVIIVNGIGSTLFLSYSITFLIYTPDRKKCLKYVLLTVLVIFSAVLYVRFDHDTTRSTHFIGLLCCLVFVVFCAAPLSMLFHVIENKSTEILPLPLILGSATVSLVWFVYGLMIKDTFIQIPNCLGFLLSLTQLSLFLIYPNRHEPLLPASDQQIVFVVSDNVPYKQF
ncbi:Sugar transporter SWEET1 [Pseudolycoriella hygida]|uniref:Sugar transporter SWEET n=1 Tax=Pseudolycoriella hygida TaxID=35572 RepID=A0A9Q0N210_9DIPT|nr:Sugar transporter SWEET1 [Pseudolycoriella hygida]